MTRGEWWVLGSTHHSSRALLRLHPFNRRARYVRRHHVRPDKLAKLDHITGVRKARREATAAAVDGQNAIVRAMRDEDARPADFRSGSEDAGREGDDAREQIAICDT